MKTKVIWKFPLHRAGQTMISNLPEGAEVLCVKKQQEDLNVWILVDCSLEKEKQKESKVFFVVGTGWEFQVKDATFRFIDTILLQDDNFVLHVFEIICPA